MGYSSRNRKKMNDKGFALVVVIVVIAFISILATILLYVSGMNYQIKVTDYRTKESFYQAEVILESFRATLISDASDAMKDAYRETVSSYLRETNAADRENVYEEAFYDAFQKYWDAHWQGEETEENYPAYSGNRAVSQLVAGAVMADPDDQIEGEPIVWKLSVDTASGESETVYFQLTFEGTSAENENGRMAYKSPNASNSGGSLSESEWSEITAFFQDRVGLIYDVYLTCWNEKAYVSEIHTSYYVTPAPLMWDGEGVRDAADQSVDLLKCVDYWQWQKQ